MNYEKIVKYFEDAAIFYRCNSNGAAKDCDKAAGVITELFYKIKKLEKENAELLARAEHAERERDAAVEALRQICADCNTCAFCKHNGNCKKAGQNRGSVEICWEWEGTRTFVTSCFSYLGWPIPRKKEGGIAIYG